MKGVSKLEARSGETSDGGHRVGIVLKQDQRTGRVTRGVVKEILTMSSYHPHGIKVRLETGDVGRVKEVIK